MKYKDTLGFDIQGLEEAQTKEQKLEALESHLKTMEGLTNELLHDLENRIFAVKSE